MPLFFANVEKHKLETKLMAFSSKINQALRLAYVVNGELPELPRSDYTYEQNERWLKDTILPHMIYLDTKNCGDTNQYRRNAVCVKLNNGDLFEFVVNVDGADIIYFPDGKFGVSTQIDHPSRKFFAFQFAKRLKSNDDSAIMSEEYIEPYTFLWDGSRNHLINDSNRGCKKGKQKFYCTKLIQTNNWKIPDDYPW